MGKVCLLNTTVHWFVRGLSQPSGVLLLDMPVRKLLAAISGYSLLLYLCEIHLKVMCFFIRITFAF